MNRTGFFTQGTKSQFLSQVSRSQLLSSLWKTQNGQNVNCPSTLPLEIETKEQIYENVARQNDATGTPLKMKQGLAYAKELMRFYKNGVTEVWRNNKRARKMTTQQFQLSGFLDRAGNDVNIRIPNFQVLTKQMAQSIYMDSTENRSQSEATTGDVVKNDKQVADTASERLFAMTRAEYQLLRRTPGDFLKIPTFAVIFIVFMEMTPILCYAFPEVAPSTCVLPSILPRIWRPAHIAKLQSQITPESIGSVDDYAMKTAYNIPTAHLRSLCDSLKLKTQYIPAWMYPEFVLRKRLQNHFNYLTVDNYYLSGVNGDGNVWDLSAQELILACLERNLVSDSKKLVDTMTKGTKSEKTEALDELRLALFRFIADFPNVNVGYLAVGHLLPALDRQMLQWRCT